MSFWDDEELTEEKEEALRDEYEYYDEWKNRDPELKNMSLYEFDESMRVSDYGLTDEDMDSGDDY